MFGLPLKSQSDGLNSVNNMSMKYSVVFRIQCSSDSCPESPLGTLVLKKNYYSRWSVLCLKLPASGIALLSLLYARSQTTKILITVAPRMFDPKLIFETLRLGIKCGGVQNSS
jgi:hypothetical protein